MRRRAHITALRARRLAALGARRVTASLLRAVAVGAAFAGIAAGCSDLESYRGSFRGVVVGTNDQGCDPAATPCSFIRRGFAENTELLLSDFDPEASGAVVGRLTTFAAVPAPDGSPVMDGTFAATALERVVALEHDRLSQFEFPGGGRVRNFIYAARPGSGPLAGRDATVFVSLMEVGTVEARILVGAGDVARGDHYGFFTLRAAP